MDDLFSPAGMTVWRNHLEDSAAFRDAARGWSGTLVLRESTHDGRRNWIALENGVLLALRAATDADHAAAEYVLSAEPATWQALVRGERDLMRAALGGDLRLERGSALRLLPHARAAAALIHAARGVS